MTKLSKNMKNCFAKIDKDKFYLINEAIKLVKETAFTKFDSSIELAIKLGIDPKMPDQQMRGTFIFPNSNGKTKKILVLCPSEEEEKLKNSQADFIGGIELINKIKIKKWFDFDIIVAHPKMMPEIGKIGQILGPKKLMPNPKSGTVTTDLEKAIKEIKAGKIEYKNDKQGNIHVVIGKVSFDDKKLIENFNAFIEVILKNKPQKSKGNLIKSASISSTMGPGLKIESNF